MAEPPLLGVDHESETCALPDVACSTVGAPGMVRGVAVTVLDACPVPAAFVALARNW